MPLSTEIADLLETNHNLLKSITQSNKTTISDRTKSLLTELRQSLGKQFKESDNSPEIYHRDDILERIWSFGPKKCGTNILLNLTDFQHQNVWSILSESTKTTTEPGSIKDLRNDLETAFVNGYQLATLAGPLCEEPMHGICFVIEEFQFDVMNDTNIVTGPISGRWTPVEMILHLFISSFKSYFQFKLCLPLRMDAEKLFKHNHNELLHQCTVAILWSAMKYWVSTDFIFNILSCVAEFYFI